MILPVKRIPDGHSVLSQKVEFSGEQAQWLAAKGLVCRAEIDRIRSQLYVHVFYDGSVKTECARCLKPVDFAVEGDFRVICVHRSETGDNSDFDKNEVDFVYDDTTDELDLTPLVYEEIMISIPMKPLCSAECPGIAIDKVPVKRKASSEKSEPVDPRWEALKRLKRLERS